MRDIAVYENLVKIDLQDNEREVISARLVSMLESFAALESVDTDGVEKMASVLDIRNVLREDVPAKSDRDSLLSNAPEQYGGYFEVPKTFE